LPERCDRCEALMDLRHPCLGKTLIAKKYRAPNASCTAPPCRLPPPATCAVLADVGACATTTPMTMSANSPTPTAMPTSAKGARSFQMPCVVSQRPLPRPLPIFPQLFCRLLVRSRPPLFGSRFSAVVSSCNTSCGAACRSGLRHLGSRRRTRRCRLRSFDLPLEVSDPIRRDHDDFPTFSTRVIEQIDVLDSAR
jgi:hypothetical protein